LEEVLCVPRADPGLGNKYADGCEARTLDWYSLMWERIGGKLVGNLGGGMTFALAGEIGGRFGNAGWKVGWG
jgi:hypothetical protein